MLCLSVASASQPGPSTHFQHSPSFPDNPAPTSFIVLQLFLLAIFSLYHISVGSSAWDSEQIKFTLSCRKSDQPCCYRTPTPAAVTGDPNSVCMQPVEVEREACILIVEGVWMH
jgi:hypothetical protein